MNDEPADGYWMEEDTFPPERLSGAEIMRILAAEELSDEAGWDSPTAIHLVSEDGLIFFTFLVVAEEKPDEWAEKVRQIIDKSVAETSHTVASLICVVEVYARVEDSGAVQDEFRIVHYIQRDLPTVALLRRRSNNKLYWQDAIEGLQVDAFESLLV